MIKETPTIGRIAAMVVFTLSCIGILLFLWLSFGGATPLRPESYRFKARIPEAATLAEEADVRLAGVNVGKVKTKALDKGGARTVIEIELDSPYAPIPNDTRAMLRQKTLLGETYVELAPGHKRSGMLPDGGELPAMQVQPTVELDEIFSAFDPETRSAFKEWITELAKAIDGRGEDLNSAFGNLEGFAGDGANLLKTLDEQQIAVRRLVRNTGEVFGAINQREGALRELIVNSNNTFEATAARDRELAETFAIFPTFLDESRATLARLERFATNTRPLVRDLRGPARDLGPTVRDLGDLAPDLERLFRDLPPLIRASRTGMPDLARVLSGAEPVFESIRPFLAQLNPIISYLNFHQNTVSSFLTIGGANFGCTLRGEGNCNIEGGARRYQVNYGVIERNSFNRFTERPETERGNGYVQPNAYLRAAALGILESFECRNNAGSPGADANGEQPDPVDRQATPADPPTEPPCFEAPASLYDGQRFAIPREGRVPRKDAPKDREGTRPAVDRHAGETESKVCSRARRPCSGRGPLAAGARTQRSSG